MHTRLQLGHHDQVSLRAGDGAVEIVVRDSGGECTSIIEISPQQLAALCDARPRPSLRANLHVDLRMRGARG
jgi:hypothetical protein